MALELGFVALILAGLLRWQASPKHRTSRRNPFLVFGQTAFFFYLMHILLLEVAGRALGMYQQRGLWEANVACVTALIVLYPVCLAYCSIKARFPRSILRYF